MTPSFSKRNTADYGLANAKHVGYFLLRNLGFKQGFDPRNILLRKFCVSVFGPPGHSPLLGGISHVNAIITKKEVGGIHAIPDIAFVANVQPCGYRSIGHRIRNAVRPCGSAVKGKRSVSVMDLIRCPNPAIIWTRYFYLIPKTGLVFFGKLRDLFCSATHSNIMGFVRAVSVLNTPLRLAQFNAGFRRVCQAR